MVWGREWQTHYFSGIGKLSQTISVISNDSKAVQFRLQMTPEHLRFMPSPELSKESWEIIDYCAENPGKRPTPDEVRGACLLWCDAVLNRHWVALLDEAYG